MKSSDRDLGMDRSITRRDFISGVGLAITSSAVAGPLKASASQRVEGATAATVPGRGQQGAAYPPGRTGIRGSHSGS